MRRTLFVQIFLPFLAVVLVSVAAVAWQASRVFRQSYFDQVAAELETDARLFALELRGGLIEKKHEEVEALCKRWGEASGKRLTVILPDGKVVGDSMQDPARMDNHGDRPEVRQALAGQLGRSVRHSFTVRDELMYFALPVEENGHVAAVVRTSASVASLQRAVLRTSLWVAVAGAVVALAAGLCSLGLARRIAGPLRQMKAAADRLAKGELEQRLPVPSGVELADLARAMNKMADELRGRIQTVHRHRGELEALLSSMEESVVAVDAGERVLWMNRAAGALFGTDPAAARGRQFQEVVRNSACQRCVARTLTAGIRTVEEVTLVGTEARHIHVVATLLRDEKGTVGAVMVASDVTELRRLERMRSDFVANVSHELRTPAAAIKGYAETLRDGALDDRESARKFIDVIVRQADRLDALVGDVLSLARIEAPDANAPIVLEPCRLNAAIEGAVNVCMPRATANGIALEVDCSDDVWVLANAPLLEQAIVNLLDNAIKYSETGSPVTVTAIQNADETAVSVRDRGCGISPEHLPRVFERFYRVDKARSRKLGGTGLGLAIVKHIAAAHHGRVTAESTVGEGSCFSIFLPPGRP